MAFNCRLCYNSFKEALFFYFLNGTAVSDIISKTDIHSEISMLYPGKTAERFPNQELCLGVVILCGLIICRQQRTTDKLENVEVSEIESIQCTGSTGEQNGEFEYMLSQEEISAFIDLLHKVELGEKVPEQKAASTGATAYYRISFINDEQLVIDPGTYFFVDGEYYVFENMDELWDEFVEFNSLHWTEKTN